MNVQKVILILILIFPVLFTSGQNQPRARDLEIPFEGQPGKYNAITDVDGVLVGHTTLIYGEDSTAVRTGVTAILPNKELRDYDAATFVFNGDAELSGAIFAEEFGYLRTPIMLTGTASNGTVYTSVIKWSIANLSNPIYMPVVADTWDATLSDFKSFPLREEHVFAALDKASSGQVEEGNVGGGTGMYCYDYKAGIGTASRVLPKELGGYTVGVLVQTNHGDRQDLLIAGAPVGKELTDSLPEFHEKKEGDGSIIIVVATDAPVFTQTLKGMAKRATFGLARTGSTASPYSGDIAIAFSTIKTEWSNDAPYKRINAEFLDQYESAALYTATIQATEEAIINSLVAGRTMTGLHGNTIYGMPHERLKKVLKKYNRIKE